jgi:hypothetical protein
MHILAIGQSNLANHCGTPAASDFGEVVHHGATSPLKDPIAGGTGDLGSVWPRVADELQRQQWPGSLRLTLAAKGGTSVQEWAPGGPCYEALTERFARGDGEGVTHVVWQQGEKDTLLETTAAAYTTDFLRMYDGITAVIGVVPWIICRTSYRFGVTSDAVVGAQSELASSLELAIAGPDLDSLGPAFRRDDTHFNDEGLSRFAAMLAQVIVQNVTP